LITLQRFKTYVNRTVITGFDPQFNAITRLNGPGKTNILDAIEFVLSSTNKEMCCRSTAASSN
jgi:structural maintenance of chromosome 2